MSIRLVVNPGAGDRSGSLEQWSERLAAAGVHVDAAAQLGDDGWASDLRAGDLLVVAGGDGSVNAAAEACVESGATLGVLPAGTANDFARTLGVPLDPEGACAVLAADHRRRVDVGRVDGRLFLNVVHVGLGAEVGPRVPHEHKQRWRRLGYLRTLVSRLWGYRGFHARIEPQGGGRAWTGRWLEVAVANGRFFGGGQELQDVRPDDGELDLVAVRPRAVHRLLGLWLAARLTGRMPSGPTLFRVRGPGFRVVSRHRRAVSADGEAFGGTPVRASVVAQALEVVAPEEPGED